MQRLVELMHEAQQEFLDRLALLRAARRRRARGSRDLTQRGVRVAVLTNSLAATDAVAVQAGYAPYRVPLLQHGVELYEFKPDQATAAGHRWPARNPARACTRKPT